MGRRKTYDREEILDRAMHLFWRHGYAGTSTADLETGMGINRYSLYAEFDSKHGLYQAALDRYLDCVVPGFIGGLSAPGAGVASIVAVLEDFAAAAGRPGTERGCLICNAATETAPDDTDTKTRVHRYVAMLTRGFQHALDGAMARGELGALDTAAWASKLATVLLGIFVLIRAGVDGDVARASARQTVQELHAHAHALGSHPPD